MILGQLRIGARATTYAALFPTLMGDLTDLLEIVIIFRHSRGGGGPTDLLEKSYLLQRDRHFPIISM